MLSKRSCVAIALVCLAVGGAGGYFIGPERACPQRTHVSVLGGKSSSGAAFDSRGLAASLEPLGSNRYKLQVYGMDDDHFEIHVRLELAHPIKELKPYGNKDEIRFSRLAGGLR